ncbi:hypothetical protein [Streptomyces sp. NPDC056387]|uniref:hypothetical protein n=1 Tax=Streptomyces sp. NPDC056387 TaxID=3345803 RepID=UPI0035DBBA12
MRFRTALTASALAAGILLGAAGAALADGVDIDAFKAGHAAAASNCSHFAGVPKAVGPLYTDSCQKEKEKEWASYSHLGAH